MPIEKLAGTDRRSIGLGTKSRRRSPMIKQSLTKCSAPYGTTTQ